mmetsp:Transcript_17738/g.58360  ORF Transcript_17738/g.58360 Transcript_17738/m.58360 type:complete len:225 (-) Transcript_17738:261-935(-)
MHGLDSIKILMHDRVEASPSLNHVTINATDDSTISLDVNIDFQVHMIPKDLFVEDKNSFNQDDGPRFYQERLVRFTEVRSKVVDRSADGSTVDELLQVLYHQLRFQTVRMIEIDVVAFFYSKVGAVAIVVVVGQHSNVFLSQVLHYHVHDRRLPASASSCDTDDKRLPVPVVGDVALQELHAPCLVPLYPERGLRPPQSPLLLFPLHLSARLLHMAADRISSLL